MFNPEIKVINFDVADVITTSSTPTVDWEGEEF